MTTPDLKAKRDAFEHAYTLSANDEQRKRIMDWLRSWHSGNTYSHTSLQDTFRGFLLATSTHIDIQEAWEMAGGNPGIKATREELESALKALDEVCDEADESIPLAEVWDALGGDSSSDTPTLKNVRTLLAVTKNAVDTLAAQRKLNKKLPMSMGFSGPIPDRNGNVYELPEITPAMQEAFENTMQQIRTLTDNRPVDWDKLIPNASDVTDVLFLVNTPRDPNERCRVVRLKEREPNTDSNLHYEVNFDMPNIIVSGAGEKVKPNVPRRAPKVDAGERMRKSSTIPQSTAKVLQKVGREILRIRKGLNMNQTEFGKLIGIEQTAVSAVERGAVTKRSDRGVSAIDKAQKLLEHIKSVVHTHKNGEQTLGDQFAESIAKVQENLSKPEVRAKLKDNAEKWRAEFAEKHGGKEWDELRKFVIDTMCKETVLPRSSDIKVGPLAIYMRAGPCLYMNGERHNAIEISRIDLQPSFRGQGYAKRFFENLSSFAKAIGIQFITVAQVHNEDFRAQLGNWGFNRLDMPAAPEDFVFIKRIDQ